jgi:hypothetical protein
MWVEQRDELRYVHKRNVSMSFVMKYVWPAFHAYISDVYSRWNDKTYDTDEAALAQQ